MFASCRSVRSGVLAVLALALVAACSSGSSGPDGEALREAFGERAAAAYESVERDRDDDFAQGVVLDEGCFVLDEEALDAIGDAMGLDDGDVVAVVGRSFLNGPPGEDEAVTCGIASGEDENGNGDADENRFSLRVGTTLVDADGMKSRALRNDDSEAVDIDVDGLDGDDVFGVDLGGAFTAAWVSDDFVVSVSGPDDTDRDDLVALLPVVVDQVERVLVG